MVQAYLGKPNYTNAMNLGLRTRLAYNEANRLRRGGGGGGGGGGGSNRLVQEPSGTTTSEDVRADADQRMKYRESQARVEEQTKRTNLMGVETPETVEKNKLANVMQKEKIEDTRIARSKAVLNDALQWVPQITQENYEDMYSLVRDSDAAASSMLATPEEVAAMSEVEWKVHHSKLEKVFDPTGKKLTSAVVAQEKADKIALAAEKKIDAGYKEYMRIQGTLDRVGNTASLPDDEYERLGPVIKAYLKGKDRTKYIELLKEYAAQLVEKHKFEPVPRKEVAPPVETAVPPGSLGTLSDPGIAQKFMEEAGGDRVAAEAAAIAAGYSL